MKVQRFAAVGALGVLAALAAGLRAQDESGRPLEPARTERINLTVDGHASVPADAVTIDLVIQASAEVGGDAEAQHRSKLRSVLQALDELKEKLAAEDRKKVPDGDGPEPPPYDVALHEGSSVVAVTGFMAGVNRARPTSAIQVATVLSVRMRGAAAASRLKLRKRLIRIIDTAIDAGAEFGAPDYRLRPGIRFEPRDTESLREAAYKDALDRARERATRLARLVGRALGAVSGVNETAWSVRGNRSDYRGPYNQYQAQQWNPHQQRRADAQGVGALMSPIDELTTNLSEIELDTTIAVEYELGKVIAK
jgi:uncharacterized protein YggE